MEGDSSKNRGAAPGKPAKTFDASHTAAPQLRYEIGQEQTQGDTMRKGPRIRRSTRMKSPWRRRFRAGLAGVTGETGFAPMRAKRRLAKRGRGEQIVIVRGFAFFPKIRYTFICEYADCGKSAACRARIRTDGCFDTRGLTAGASAVLRAAGAAYGGLAAIAHGYFKH